MRPKCRWLFLFALCGLVVLTSDPARAQSEADRAAAQTLFEEGQKLMEDGDTAAACPKFQASQELDPATGTQLNLAVCYEKLGKTASAWINFTEIADTSSVDERRRKYARGRAEALEPKLVRLVVEVPNPAPEMKVTRGDVAVPRPTWGAAIPVDPGQYEVIARAPGRLTWRDRVEVEGEGETVSITVPALVVDDSAVDDELPITPEPKGGKGDEAEGGNGQTIAGITLLVVGGVGLGVGGVLAGLAHSKASESNDFCGAAVGGANDDECLQEGVDLRSSAQGMQMGYFISFGVGGAAAIAGLITLLTAPSTDDGGDDGDELGGVTLRPTFGPTGSGLGIAGTF